MNTKEKDRIAAIVVTFNKKELLVNAINGILNQELVPDKLIIVDNNSTDGTANYVLDNGWINSLPVVEVNKNTVSSKFLDIENGIRIEIDYIKKHKNDGGAGGFYEGMKRAFDLGYDWLWMMDDDGVPDKYCLKYLFEKRDDNIVSGPLVVDIETEKTASFIFDDINRNELVAISKISKKEILKNILTPFNGTFIPRNVIEKIGFVKKEMFIWGDEAEYQNRILKNSFEIQTVTKALHKHPINKKKPKYRSDILKFTIYEISSSKFLFFFFRNYVYLYHQYPKRNFLGLNFPFFKIIYEILINSGYYALKGDFFRSRLCIKAIGKGLRGDFTYDEFNK